MISDRDDLYFIVSPALNRVKIGRGHTQNRLRSLRTGSPDPDLRIILMLPDMGHLENRVHKAWAMCWSHGEWFNLNPSLAAWISIGAPMDTLPEDDLNHLPVYVNRDHVRALSEMIH